MKFSTWSARRVFCWSSHTRLLKLFTSVMSHSAVDVDNLDRGVMTHEEHSAKTRIYSHGVARLNGDRHDGVSFYFFSDWGQNLIISFQGGILHKHPIINWWDFFIYLLEAEKVQPQSSSTGKEAGYKILCSKTTQQYLLLEGKRAHIFFMPLFGQTVREFVASCCRWSHRCCTFNINKWWYAQTNNQLAVDPPDYCCCPADKVSLQLNLSLSSCSYIWIFDLHRRYSNELKLINMSSGGTTRMICAVANSVEAG